MTRRVAIICSGGLWAYEHGDDHPLRAERLRRTAELLDAYKLFGLPNVVVVEPRLATPAELCLFHTAEYVEVVRKLSDGDLFVPYRDYGFGPGDNPVFPHMYESEALKVGGSLEAAARLVKGACDIAFNFAGGMHHAGPAEASGFCVFNDAAVALRWLEARGLRVAYVDIDVHHGDGVQWAFYDSDRVLTVSLHQSGRTLFPGSGSVGEVGREVGLGYCVNVPLPISTDDEAYVAAFDSVVLPVVGQFQPDLLVTQLGVDTHFLDPLADLALTTAGHLAVFERLAALGLPWLALGGGGYAIDVVPRAWTLAVGVMAGVELSDEIPASYRQRYGRQTLRDSEGPTLTPEERQSIRARVEAVIASVRQRHGLTPRP
jgi:acetoin utilization protein AcuC